MRRLMLAWILSIVAAVNASAADESAVRNLLRYIPSSTNTLLVYDVAAILESPIAKAENWAEEMRNASARGLALSTETELLVVGTELGDSWSAEAIYGVSQIKTDFSPEILARAERGYTETIADTEAIWTPRNTYFLKLDEKILGAYYPEDRQGVSRWLRSVSRLPNISPFLQRAAYRVAGDQAESQIVLAIDVLDALSPIQLEEKLAVLDFVKDAGIDQAAAARALASAVGITLTVELTDKAYGILEVEHSEDVTVLAPIAKQLALHALEVNGLYVADLENWEAGVVGKQFIFEGELSEVGLKLISSFVTVPTATLDEESAQGNVPIDQVDPQIVAKATQEYYQSMRAVAQEFYDMKPKIKNRPLSSQGIWLGKFATKIDQLPVLNVDPEMLDFGRVVTAALRDASAAFRNVKLRTQYRASSGNYGYYGSGNSYGYGYGYGGYSGWQNNVQSRMKNTIRQESTSATFYVNGQLDQLKNLNTEIRQRMTQKYGIEF